MGFFDKMFEKKECAICGTELGPLGKTKINEGYLCKECAGKLSPTFTAIAPAPRTISVSNSPPRGQCRAPGVVQPHAYAFCRAHQYYAR